MTLNLLIQNMDTELLQPAMSVRSGERNGLNNTSVSDHRSFGEILNEKNTAVTEAGREKLSPATKRAPAKEKEESPLPAAVDSAEDSSEETDAADSVSPDTLKRQAFTWIDPHSSGTGKAASAVSASSKTNDSQQAVASTEAISSQPFAGITLKDAKAEGNAVLSAKADSRIQTKNADSNTNNNPTPKDGKTLQATDIASAAQKAEIASVLESEPSHGPVVDAENSALRSTDLTASKGQDTTMRPETIKPTTDILRHIPDAKTHVAEQISNGLAENKQPDRPSTNRGFHPDIALKEAAQNGKSADTSNLTAHAGAPNEEPQFSTINADKSPSPKDAAALQRVTVPDKEDMNKMRLAAAGAKDAASIPEKKDNPDNAALMTPSQKDRAVSQSGEMQSAASTRTSTSSSNDTAKKKSVQRGSDPMISRTDAATTDTGSQKNFMVTGTRSVEATDDQGVHPLTFDARKEPLEITASKTRGTEKISDLSAMESLNAFSTFHENVAVATDGAGALNADAIINQIADKKPFVSKDMSRVKITLNPPDLGTVDLEVVVRKNRVEVVMTADHSGVQQILQSHVDDIKSALQSQDMKIDSFQVYLQADSDGSRQQTNQWAAMYDHGRGRNTSYTDKEESPNVSPVSGNHPIEQHSGLLSVFA